MNPGTRLTFHPLSRWNCYTRSALYFYPIRVAKSRRWREVGAKSIMGPTFRVFYAFEGGAYGSSNGSRLEADSTRLIRDADCKNYGRFSFFLAWRKSGIFIRSILEPFCIFYRGSESIDFDFCCVKHRSVRSMMWQTRIFPILNKSLKKSSSTSLYIFKNKILSFA